jgi:hypothetical protein
MLQVADALDDALSSNLARVGRENARVQALSGAAWRGTLSLWLLCIGVCVVFALVVVLMRLVPAVPSRPS